MLRTIRRPREQPEPRIFGVRDGGGGFPAFNAVAVALIGKLRRLGQVIALVAALL